MRRANQRFIVAPQSAMRQLEAYATTFPLIENPLSESGLWVNGATTGLDWHDMQVADLGGGSHVLCGTQDGTFDGTNFRDSVAVLQSRIWSPNHLASGRVRIANRNNTALSEVELWLRAKGAANFWRGYECTISCRSVAGYINATRWNGVLNSFTSLGDGTPVVLQDGDLFEAYIVGTQLVMTQNGIVVYTVDITSIGGAVYRDGSPGAGHWRHDNGAVGVQNTDFGFYSFAARDLP